MKRTALTLLSRKACQRSVDEHKGSVLYKILLLVFLDKWCLSSVREFSSNKKFLFFTPSTVRKCFRKFPLCIVTEDSATWSLLSKTRTLLLSHEDVEGAMSHPFHLLRPDSEQNKGALRIISAYHWLTLTPCAALCLQTLPQHGSLQSLRLAGCLHWREGGRGPQSQLLSRGHVLWPGRTQALRLHRSHTGRPPRIHQMMFYWSMRIIDRHMQTVVTSCSSSRASVRAATTRITPTLTASGLTSPTCCLETMCLRWEWTRPDL